MVPGLTARASGCREGRRDGDSGRDLSPGRHRLNRLRGHSQQLEAGPRALEFGAVPDVLRVDSFQLLTLAAPISTSRAVRAISCSTAWNSARIERKRV